MREPRERIWLLRNEDGSLDDCWQMSTIQGSGDLEYISLAAHQKAVQEVWRIVRSAAELSCLRGRRVHCAENESNSSDWCVPCQAKYVLGQIGYMDRLAIIEGEREHG